MAKKIIITEKQLKDTLSMQLINCNGFVNTLYKYMAASRVLDILENNSHLLGFVSPESWYDPYETKYLNTDYTALNGYRQPKIYCFCARMDNLNEEASWKIYKKENEPLLRMSIRAIDLLLAIDKFAKENDCDVYFSKVDYRLKKKEIDELYLPSSPYHSEFFNNLDDKQYVRIMSLKRWAFNYENEYRIFIIPRNQDKIVNHIKDNVLFIPVPIKMITRFTFYPAGKANSSLVSQIEIAKYNAEYKLIKDKIKVAYPEATVVKSTLYSKVKNVEKI
ncbi:MAG: DUF2971 domain-containing protein [Bacteroides sp.]|nr:DUF2971 domain-containing protein [Bacteroides sp.]